MWRRRCRHEWYVEASNFSAPPSALTHVENASTSEVLYLQHGLTSTALRCKHCRDLRVDTAPGDVRVLVESLAPGATRFSGTGDGEFGPVASTAESDPRWDEIVQTSKERASARMKHIQYAKDEDVDRAVERIMVRQADLLARLED